jgi:hypothetical protein
MNISAPNLTLLTHLVKEPVKSTKELVQEYCKAVDHRLIYLLGVIFLIWLMESKFKTWAESLKFENDLARSLLGGKNLISAYKMLGLGLLFLAIYLFIVRGW